MKLTTGAVISILVLGSSAIAIGHEKSHDLHGTMQGGMKQMDSMKMTGNVDRDFMMMMKMHHQQALDMASVVIRDGKDAEVKAFAMKIKEAQTKEIAEMDGWLQAHPEKEAKSPTDHTMN